MRVVLAARTKGRIEFGIIFGVIAILALLAARFLPVLSLAPACAFRAVTGLPCLTCGATRSIVHLSHGDFLPAFSLNPLFAVSVVAAVLWLFYSLISLVFNLPTVNIALAVKEKKRVRFYAVLLLLLNWFYLVLAG